jgi:hypothetical protein
VFTTVRIGILAAAALVAACGDDDGASSSVDASLDAGATDSGGSGGRDAALPACTPPPDDAGPPLVACNPIDGTRCELSTGTRCVLDPAQDEGACVCLEGDLGLQQPCDPAQNACAPGFACFGLDTPGLEDPVCRKICEFESGSGCRDIDPSGVEAYECGGLLTPEGEIATYGFCLFVGESCDLLQNDCPPNQTCTITGLETACAGVGNTPSGEECSLDNRCQRGLVCVRGPEDLDPECKEVCDPEAVEDPCPLGSRCRAFTDLPGGICSTR